MLSGLFHLMPLGLGKTNYSMLFNLVPLVAHIIALEPKVFRSTTISEVCVNVS